VALDAPVTDLTVHAYTIPTDAPEADGTLTWDSTTIVVVQATTGETTGTGWTYGPVACATVVDHELRPVVTGRDALDPPGACHAMVRSIRNAGRPGVASCAISAVDVALWDLAARLVDLPLHRYLGAVRDEVPVYGSGGFTSYDESQLRDQLVGWTSGQGIGRVKIKIGESRGTRPQRDLERMRQARGAIGDDVELFVDANGGYSRKQAIRVMREASDLDIRWFEEPVSSDDLDGMRTVRYNAPPGMAIAAGEYGYTADYLHRMLDAKAVDVLQADVTRCAGFTGWLQVAALCEAHHIDLSGHCAPALHLHAACAAPRLRHLEWFHDHVRIEHMLFDGAPAPRDGMLRPDLSRPGIGLALKRQDAARYRAC
jgi:L-alanine-DL-glutamate epimerase-like enolase superfamily enzyme